MNKEKLYIPPERRFALVSTVERESTLDGIYKNKHDAIDVMQRGSS